MWLWRVKDILLEGLLSDSAPLLNFEEGPGILLLNFEGGPGVPLLNFRGVPGPTFKLWGGFRVLGPRVPGSWSHFCTMPPKNTSGGMLLINTHLPLNPYYCYNHIQNSQSVFSVNQLTRFYMKVTLLAWSGLMIKIYRTTHQHQTLVSWRS